MHPFTSMPPCETATSSAAKRASPDAIRERDRELESELLFAQFGDFDQRATVGGANGDGSAQTAENRDQMRP